MMPLEGIKVLDFTQAAGGPFCGMLIGDMGADVLKIEPLSGDHFRPMMGGAWAAAINRNKRGLAVDLRTEEGKQIINKLIEGADVFLEAFVPGVMEKLGFGYDAVSKINPKIIYCSISGYGQDGPYRGRSGYDVCAQCESGLLAATGEPDRPPVRIGSSLIDYGTGMYGFLGILLALRHRDKTGKGQKIDVSLLDTAISWMNYWVTHHSLTGESPPRVGSGHLYAVPYQVFETKDKPVFVGVSMDRFWVSFCKMFKLEHLLEDPRFKINSDRVKNREILVPLVQEVLRNYSSEEVFGKLNELGIPTAYVNTVGQMMDDEHVKARNAIVEMEYKPVGKVKVSGIPIRMSESPGEIRLSTPVLGQHTAEVLKELGYSDEKIKELADNKVIGLGS